MEKIELTSANVRKEDADKYNGKMVLLDKAERVYANSLKDVVFSSEKDFLEIKGFDKVCVDIHNSENIVFDKPDSKKRYWLKLDPNYKFQAFKFRHKSKNLIIRGVEIVNSSHASLNIKNDPSKIQLDKYKAEITHNLLNPDNKVIVHEHLEELDYGRVIIDRCRIHKGLGEGVYSGYSFVPYGKTQKLEVTNTNISNHFWDIFQVKRAEIAIFKNCIFRNGGLENKTNQRSGLQLENSDYLEYKNCVIDGGVLRSIFIRKIKNIKFKNCVITNFPLSIFAHDSEVIFDSCFFINLGLLKTTIEKPYIPNTNHKKQFIIELGYTNIKFIDCKAKKVVENEAILKGVNIDNSIPEIEYEYSEEGEEFVKGFYKNLNIGTIKDDSVKIDSNYSPEKSNNSYGGSGFNLIPQIIYKSILNDKKIDITGGRIYLEIDGKKQEEYSTQYKEAYEKAINLLISNPNITINIITDNSVIKFK